MPLFHFSLHLLHFSVAHVLMTIMTMKLLWHLYLFFNLHFIISYQNVITLICLPIWAIF